MIPLAPILVPSATVLLALLSDRGNQKSPKDEFGAVPALAVVAAPLIAVPPVAAVAAGAAVIGMSGYMLWRWTQPELRVDPANITWAAASTAVAASSGPTAQALQRAGLHINPQCVWILSPPGILKRFIDLIESRALSDKLVMATMGEAGVKSTLGGAGQKALRQLHVSRLGVPDAAASLPGIGWMVEAVYLLVQALMYLKGTPLLDVALEAFEELLTDLMGCWNGIRKFWPYHIGRVLGVFFSLFTRFARWAVGSIFSKGVGAVTIAVLATWLDDYFETQGQADGVNKEGIGGAMNWLFWIFENKEMPPEIEEATDKSRPAGRLTGTVEVETPADFELRLSSVEIPGMEFTLAPPGPLVISVPQTAWIVSVRRSASDPWQSMAKAVPALEAAEVGAPARYRFAWAGDSVQVLNSKGAVVWSDTLLAPSASRTPLAPLSAGRSSYQATWSAQPGYEFYLQPRTAPGSSKATYASASVLGPGEVPAGEYRLVVRLEPGGELHKVKDGLELLAGKDYRVTVSPDGSRMTFSALN